MNIRYVCIELYTFLNNIHCNYYSSASTYLFLMLFDLVDSPWRALSTEYKLSVENQYVKSFSISRFFGTEIFKFISHSWRDKLFKKKIGAFSLELNFSMRV